MPLLLSKTNNIVNWPRGNIRIKKQRSNVLDLLLHHDGVVHFDLFPAQRHEVHSTLMLLGQTVELTELQSAVFAVVAQHVRLLIALRATANYHLWRLILR